MDTVKKVLNDNLCISCGICKGVCPIDAIQYERNNGIYEPLIDESKCINCGKCYKICPGRGYNYEEHYGEEVIDYYRGKYSATFNVMSKDLEILAQATSGGVVTTLVNKLLLDKEYELAFLVDTYDYSEQVKTNAFYAGDQLKNTQKSRYIPVSQTSAIEYILKYKESKVILVGVSCFVHGVLNVIKENKLNRDNYFIIGLFCDKNYNYNIYDYFVNQYSNSKKKVKDIFFRSKDSMAMGWPGNMRFVYDDGSVLDVENKVRIGAKDYFQMEGCMYCIDKTNQLADISVGDNYTGENEDVKGVSSIIVRSDIGSNAWNKYKSNFDVWSVDADKLFKSQRIEERKKNELYRRIKNSEHYIIPYTMKNDDVSDKAITVEYNKKKKLMRYGATRNWKAIRVTNKKRTSKLRGKILYIKYKLYEIKTKLLRNK